MRPGFRALVLLFFFCFARHLYAGIVFGNPDLNDADELLFTVEHNFPGAVNYKSLFTVRLEDGKAASFPRILTCFPEKMDLLSGGEILQIRNRYGSAEYSFVTSALKWENLSDSVPLHSVRPLPVSVSPDGNWLCFVKRKLNTTGVLILENVHTGVQVLLNDNAEIDYTDIPVKWSPDSSVVLYEKKGTLYFCSPDASVKDMYLSDNFHKIGPGSIHSICFSRDARIVYICNDIIYRFKTSELYTLGLYSAFVSSEAAAAVLPVPFNAVTDSFAVNDDASELSVIRSNRLVEWYRIRQNSYTYVQTLSSYTFIDDRNTVRKLSVIWPVNTVPVVCADMVSLSDGRDSVCLFRIDNGLKQISEVSSPDCYAVSPDGTKVAFASGTSVFEYSTLAGNVMSVLPDEKIFSLVWRDNTILYAGGSQTVREWNTAAGTYRLLFLSSAEQGVWDRSSGALTARTVSAAYTYDSKKNVWEILTGTVSGSTPAAENGRYRVYTDSAGNPFYDNTLYVRTLTGKAVTRPLLEESMQAVSPARKVAVVFDAADDAAGLPAILSVLERYHLKCTFFISGDFIRHYPKMTNLIAGSGQECASLFYTSADLTAAGFVIDEDFIRRGLARNEDEFYACTGKELSLLWHAPGYKSNSDIEKAGAAAGYRYIGTSVRDRDDVTLEDAVCSKTAYHSSSALIDEYMNLLSLSENPLVIPVSVGISRGYRTDYLYDKLEQLVNILLDAGYDIVPAGSLLSDK
jgi:peptidoglycan/xylan/chitin deacetylase (PgdA/CDA1 family)